MFDRLPKAYRKKYDRQLGWDEEFIRFAAKIVCSATLFFVIAVSVDAYRFLH